MKARADISGRLMILLAAIALAGLVAFIVPSVFFSLPLFAFSRQIMIIAGFWLVCGLGFYFAISRAADRFDSVGNLFPARLTFQQAARRVFLAVFLLFPLGLLTYQHFHEFFQVVVTGQVYDPTGWMAPLTGAGAYTLTSLAYVLLAVYALILLAGRPHIRQYFEGLSDRYIILVILLAALSIRLFFIYTVNSQPFSDFDLIHLDALRLSQGDNPQEMYVATHVIVTMIYGLLYKVFGPYLLVIKIFQALLHALSGIFIFYTGKEILGSRFWAGVTGILAVSWPSLALYSNVLTPEHLFLFVECALLYFVVRFFKKQRLSPHTDGWLAGIWDFVLLGFLFGLLGMFRPFSQLFSIAFLLTLVIYARDFDQLKKTAVKALVLVLVAWLLGVIPGIIASHYDNVFINVRPCSLLVGMNIESMGQFNVADKDLCWESGLASADQNKFTQIMLETVLGRLHAHQDQILSFMAQKFEILWTNSNLIVFWAIQLAEGEDKGPALALARNVNLIDFSMMLVATLACLIGTVIAFFKDVKPAVFFMLLTFLAFNLMEIIFEVQTRYRTVVMPLYIFFACWAIAGLAPRVQEKYSEWKAHQKMSPRSLFSLSPGNAIRQPELNEVLPVLDGLRFLAFLLIFINNAPLLGSSPIWQWLHRYGWMGVDMFLCLSAYLYTKLLLTEFQQTGSINIQKFYIRRALHIWPLYYLFLIFMLVLTYVIFPERLASWRVVGLFTFTDNFFAAAVQSYNLVLFAGHLWMISLEEQFHAVIPWALRPLFKMSPRAKTWMILGALLVGSLLRYFLVLWMAPPQVVILVLPFTRFEAILLGILLGLGSLDALLEQVPPLASGLLGLLSLNAATVKPGIPFLTYILPGLGMALILHALLRVSHRFEWRWITSRPMVYLGRISYGLYVYHLLSLGLARQYLRVEQTNYWLWVAAVFILPLLGTIAAASLSHAVIEKPFLRLRERFSLDRSRH